MSRRPSHLTIRAAVLALVLLVGAAPLAWARAALGPVPGRTAEACGCCEERPGARDARIAGDCCEVRRAPDAPWLPAAHGVLPPAPALDVPPVVTLAPVASPALVPATILDVLPRAAGPPLWLRTRSLRL